MQKIVERFLGYVKIDTQSNPESMTCPSTEKQWVLAKRLFEELKAIGLSDVTLDDNGYIMATLPSNVEHQVPTIGFIAHYDTSPDFSGQGVNPQIIEKYNGEDIVLNEAENIVLSASYFHDIHQYRGQTLITTDGKTLLGADDKAGVAEIVTAMEYLIAHPEIKHGTIRVAFTPDEEIGRGAHKFDVAKFGAQWAYTMDGSHVGELEYENFNAATATIKIKGRGVHPGYAKGKMINAILIAAKLIRMLPKDQIPAKTEGYEGFYHVTDVKGNVEEAEIQLIIRDHDRSKLELKKRIIDAIIHDLRFVYKHATISVDIRDQYYNMKEKIEPVMHIVNIARKAMEELGITPIIKPIRGGTDGSQLSFMGLPCPNIFAGGVNFHGKYEYVPVESMIKATQVIVKIAELTAAK